MHSIIKSWLEEEGYKKYKEFLHLNNEESKFDPEDDPFKSKYKARDILKALKCKLEDFMEDSSETVSQNEANVDDTTSSVTAQHLLCVIHYELAVNYVECEEVPTGQEYLDKCIQIINKRDLEFSWVTLSITVNNQYGILWSNRCSYEEAYNYLVISEKLFTDYKNKTSEAPLNYKSFWAESNNELIENKDVFFESLHTHTLYYLAQAYGIRGDTKTSSKYCHITLARQMEMKQYDPLDWSLNCATLSQYYVTQDQYNFARYCLSCAELINKEVFVKLESMEFSEQNEKERTEEKMLKSKADVFRCWAKYGLNLLKHAHASNAKTATSEINTESMNEEHENFKELRFKDLEVSVYEERVTDKLPTTYAEAKALFVYSLKCLEQAKEFYQLDGYVTAYVEITQDISQLYKYLSFFDDSFDNRCKMHKRRIDMLNAILLELNPQHYLVICRQLTFEIAEAYSDLSELKKAIIEENPAKFSTSSVRKINHLLLQSIKYYQGFVDSYQKEGKLPDKIEADDVRGVLICYFYMARLNSKYYTNDKQTKLSYLEKEKKCYEFIVEYCDEDEHASDVFKDELGISREMLGLFHAKVNKVLDTM
eukprot:TCONS_00025650-protein